MSKLGEIGLLSGRVAIKGPTNMRQSFRVWTEKSANIGPCLLISKKIESIVGKTRVFRANGWSASCIRSVDGVNWSMGTKFSQRMRRTLALTNSVRWLYASKPHDINYRRRVISQVNISLASCSLENS